VLRYRADIYIDGKSVDMDGKFHIHGKPVYSCEEETNRRATERHLPYGITLLPATRHGQMRPALTPTKQDGTRFTR